MGMFCIFDVYCRQLKLGDSEKTQNILMTAVEILKLPAQNMAYADEYHV
jgi:acyl-homoserine lactone acylase PvdQ